VDLGPVPGPPQQRLGPVGPGPKCISDLWDMVPSPRVDLGPVGPGFGTWIWLLTIGLVVTCIPKQGTYPCTHRVHINTG
jgi:hypothetical protein